MALLKTMENKIHNSTAYTYNSIYIQIEFESARAEESKRGGKMPIIQYFYPADH